MWTEDLLFTKRWDPAFNSGIWGLRFVSKPVGRALTGLVVPDLGANRGKSDVADPPLGANYRRIANYATVVWVLDDAARGHRRGQAEHVGRRIDEDHR